MDETTISLRPVPPDHLDEATVRAELTRVFDVCTGCRRCVDRCGTFPMLFELIGSTRTAEAGMLTPADQDAVVDSCHGCGACRTDCPYAPGLDPAGVDVPTLMVRAVAMRRATGQQPRRDRRTALWLGVAPRTISAVTTSRPLLRRVVSAVTGLSARRRTGHDSSTRFSVWSARRTRDAATGAGSVTIVPTCLVEFQRPDLGRDLVGLHERAGVGCEVAPFRCCGAPAYHSGDLRRFRRTARRMVASLAERAAPGASIVVPEATCADVIRRRYPEVLAGPAIDRVVAAVVGPVEHLGRIAVRSAGEFPGRAVASPPERIVHRTAPVGPLDGETAAVVDLLGSLGCAVTVTGLGAGSSGPWGLRAANDTNATMAAAALAAAATVTGAAVITSGDVHIALLGDSGAESPVVLHPVEILARTLGIGED